MEALNNSARCMNGFGMSARAFRALLRKLRKCGRELATQRMTDMETVAIGIHALRHGTGHRQTGLEFNRTISCVSE